MAGDGPQRAEAGAPVLERAITVAAVGCGGRSTRLCTIMP